MEEGTRLYTYRYTVTTRMTSTLRWAAMRAILMFHNCEGQSHKTVSTNHNLFDDKGYPKRYRTEVLPLTSLTPCRWAKPTHETTHTASAERLQPQTLSMSSLLPHWSAQSEPWQGPGLNAPGPHTPTPPPVPGLTWWRSRES